MKRKSISVIGWYGVLAILLAYSLLTFGVVGAKDYAYQLLNLTGAIGLIIEAWSKKDLQPVALNIVWALVAMVALTGIIVGNV